MLQHNIETVISHGNDETLAAIDTRLEELQAQLVKLASSKAGYNDIAEEIYHLREQKQQALVKSANQDEIRSRIDNMAAFIKTRSTAAITQFDDHLVRQLIEIITVFEDSCTVEFKSGVTVDVEE
jgi:site-specific DNA recombinase